MICNHCEERFEQGDKVFAAANSGQSFHEECFIRMVVGSVAHQKRQCPCFGGADDHAASNNLTLREDARQAFAYFTAARKRLMLRHQLN